MEAEQSVEEVSTNEIVAKLKPIVAKVLRISEVELIENEPLTHYGISSFTTIVLLQKINKSFCIKLKLEEISMNQSIDSLKQLISIKLRKVPTYLA